jgi:hypothetical protein
LDLTKGIEIANVIFDNTFECIWFKCAFGLENYEFSKWSFNKNYSFYVIKGMNVYRIKM